MLVDTHCHLNFDAYDGDRAAVIGRAHDAGVTRIINPGIDHATSSQGIQLAAHYEGVLAAVGIHPNSASGFEASRLQAIEELAGHPKVVAIGEIGLDYYWDKSAKSDQFRALEEQLALAARLELPVIIHNRDADEDVIAILENWASELPTSLRERPGVLHSFSAGQEIAARAISAGFYLGFTGRVTYKNADDLRRTAADVPLDRILVETDGPFLTPLPFRGTRNEPAYVAHIVKRLAALKRVDVEAVAQATTKNAERLFQLPV